MKIIRQLISATTVALLLTTGAVAAETHSTSHQHEMATGGTIEGAMAKMHHAMGDMKPTGNVDVDFVKGMIPHHQGAIDMAKIELEKGKDPAIRKMAKEIIKAQEKEIADMRKWLSHQNQ